MARENNYLIQAAQARQRFCTYDQEKLVKKLNLAQDDTWLYTRFLGIPYRIHRVTGALQRQEDGIWEDANTYEETMTILDLVCDSREDRHLTYRWKDMVSFGQMFHRSLLEEGKDPWAQRFDANPEGLRKACIAMGGQPFPQGDVAYILEVFDGLQLVVQLWQGDEEFPPRLRILWDENALMYIRYETMYFAKGLLLQQLRRHSQ